MSLAAITVILALVSDEPDGAMPAVTHALHVALGDETRVLVESGASSDASLLARADVQHAELVVVVVWSDHQRHASLRFARVGEGRWLERELHFDAEDAPSERGRTVGFAIASMFPEEILQGPRTAPEPTTMPSEVSPAVPRDSSFEPPSTFGPPPAPSAPAARPSRTNEEAAPRRRLDGLGATSIEVAGLAATGVGGYGGGIGGEIGLRIPVGAGFRLRFGLGARFAEVAPAQASSRILTASAGAAWQTWVDTAHRWFIGPRVDAFVQRHELVHLSDDDIEPAHQSRWVPGGLATLELGLRFTQQAAVFTGAGGELTFGKSSVFVRRREVAEVAAARVLAEAGLRVSF